MSEPVDLASPAGVRFFGGGGVCVDGEGTSVDVEDTSWAMWSDGDRHDVLLQD